MNGKDYKTSIIEYALDELIKSLDGKDDESSNTIREGAKRSKALMQHIRIYGANDAGMTLEEYIEVLNNKKVVYVLSNEEVDAMDMCKSVYNLSIGIAERAGWMRKQNE